MCIENCIDTGGCVAIDYTNKSTTNDCQSTSSCRMYNRSNTPMIDAGNDDRKYCMAGGNIIQIFYSSIF